MTKRKGKIIKRIYEEGREKTVFYAKRKGSAKKRMKEIPIPAESAAAPLKVPEFVRQPIQEVKKVRYERKSAPGIQETKPLAEHYDLPSEYGTTRLTLMAKDPFWVFAYWEIAAHAVESLRDILPKEDMDSSRRVLRMYDVTLVDFDGSNANRYFDIEVGHTDNWYVNTWTDDVSYVGDIGLRVPDGRFFALARSNVVHTPRTSYSPRGEQIWMSVTDEKYAKPYALSERLEIAPGWPIREAKLSAPSIKVTEISATKKKAKVFYLADDEIRQYYGKLSPLLRDIIGHRISRQYGRKETADTHWFLLEGENEDERNRLLSMLPKDYFFKRLLLGSSQELIITQGASEHLVKGPGASDFVQEKIKQQKFFFELNTELIVYGRTEPDAELRLGDKKIDLRSDGTFSLRFRLPDGKIPLEFRAISGDKKQERRINTYVERNTVHPAP